MHWVGKVSAWLLVLLILGATVLTSKFITVRNSWVSKSEKLKEDAVKLEAQVREAEATAERLQFELHRAHQLWGQSYPATGGPPVRTTVQNPAEGTLAVSLGAKSDPPIHQGQWLYGFETLGDGTTVYRGTFVADAVRDGESLLAPNWRLRPEDTQGWQSGNWRWRVQLPSAYPNRFDELEQALVRQDELLGDRTQTLAVQEALIAAAKEQLRLREAELVGGPELPQNPALNPEFRLGLIAALEEAEESRNAELLAIDQLRRSVRLLRRQIEDLEAGNRDLAGKLPQPATAVSQKP
ncbi:MAG: hypothetical protein U0872_03440 [Planctomycetaceae bacterium]